MCSDIKTNRDVVYSCKGHVVWCTEYIRKVLVNTVELRLKEIIHRTAQEFRAIVIALEVKPDQLHLLCEVDPRFGIQHLLPRRLWIMWRCVSADHYVSLLQGVE